MSWKAAGALLLGSSPGIAEVKWLVDVNPGRWIVPQGNTAAVAEVRRAAWDV